MEAICRDAGIKHGKFVGTGIPYIWTIDLCLFLPWVKSPSRAACFVSVKPLESEQYLYVDPLDRGPEKLEGERRFAEQLGVPYYIGDRSLFPGPLFPQLEVLADAAVLPRDHPWANTLQRYLDRHGVDLGTTPLIETRERLICDFKASAREATFLQHHMLWHQIVDYDVSMPIREHLSPLKGGRVLKQAIRDSLVGGLQ